LENNRFSRIDLKGLRTPCYLVDEEALQRNLQILDRIQRQTGCRILLALKAFALSAAFPLLSRYLAGTCASSLHEARLGRERFGGEVHVYAPAYSREDLLEMAGLADVIIFNTGEQFQRLRSILPGSVRCGLRVNPEYSEIEVGLYNPCAPDSRLGIPLRNFPADLDGISGLHFHALCEQNADTLERVLNVVEEKFGSRLPGLEWINLGGGHHITRPDYRIDLLEQLIAHLQEQYDVQVYLEPGEAVALNTGVLVTSVLDIFDVGIKTAILDTSAEAHMPDVLAMPYRPEILGAAKPGTLPFDYRLAGPSCLAGDIIGDYSFPRELARGDHIVLMDMAHYTMVKNTTFNGMRLPSIALLQQSGGIRVVREFGYDDFVSRLG